MNTSKSTPLTVNVGGDPPGHFTVAGQMMLNAPGLVNSIMITLTGVVVSAVKKNVVAPAIVALKCAAVVASRI
jgi:hypothetical protein